MLPLVLDGDGLRACRQVPDTRGVKVFRTPAELAEELDLEKLDRKIKEILGEEAFPSENSEAAASRLWILLEAQLPLLIVHSQFRPKIKRISSLSNKEMFMLVERPEENKPYYERIRKKLLFPVEKVALDYLIRDGRGMWNAAEIAEVLLASFKEKMGRPSRDFRMGVRRVRNRLIDYLFLRVIPMRDFEKLPKYAKFREVRMHRAETK